MNQPKPLPQPHPEAEEQQALTTWDQAKKVIPDLPASERIRLVKLLFESINANKISDGRFTKKNSVSEINLMAFIYQLGQISVMVSLLDSKLKKSTNTKQLHEFIPLFPVYENWNKFEEYVENKFDTMFGREIRGKRIALYASRARRCFRDNFIKAKDPLSRILPVLLPPTIITLGFFTTSNQAQAGELITGRAMMGAKVSIAKGSTWIVAVTIISISPPTPHPLYSDTKLVETRTTLQLPQKIYDPFFVPAVPTTKAISIETVIKIAENVFTDQILFYSKKFEKLKPKQSITQSHILEKQPLSKIQFTKLPTYPDNLINDNDTDSVLKTSTNDSEYFKKTNNDLSRLMPIK